MEGIEIFGRIVFPVTTMQAQKNYYDKLNYWRSCFHNTNLRILPTMEDAEEYLRLKNEKSSLVTTGEIIQRKKEKKLEDYENHYDWRPKKSGESHLVGLVSPCGEQLIPNIFYDIFTQFDAINDRPDFIPVFNGEAWALVSLSVSPVLMTDFQYNAIIHERWERRLFFVQDKETMKWGVLSALTCSTNKEYRRGEYLTTIKQLMPCIADDIYEDEFTVDDTDEMPSLFFMIRAGKKVGVLTDFGYSDIRYDKYEVDNRECSFRLICNGRKRVHRANWWQPDGKSFI